jgi:hypothetical protein
MCNVVDVWDRRGHCHEAYSRASRLHTTNHDFEGASSRFIEYMDLCTALIAWKHITGTAYLVDKEEVDSRKELAMI